MDLAAALKQALDSATARSREVFGGGNAKSAAQVTAFIEEFPVALVSTVGADGAPHVTGKGVVLLDGRIYMGVERLGAMGRNIHRDGRVALAFAEPPWKRHVLVQGTGRFLEPGGDEEAMAAARHGAVHGWESRPLGQVRIGKIFTWKD